MTTLIQRVIPIATRLEELADRKQRIIAHQVGSIRNNNQFEWVPTISETEFRAITGKDGLREAGAYGTAQRRMPDGSVVDGNRTFYEMVCWRR